MLRLLNRMILALILTQLMTDALDRDVDQLGKWISAAWRRLADPSLTIFDRRELRNSMKEAEIALRVVLKRVADRERARRGAQTAVLDMRSLGFRILQLEARSTL